MYIPASLASGATSVNCTVPLSGNLVAACEVVYEGTTYSPGTSIAVAQGKVVTLKTTVTAYAEISVQLRGKQYYWFVDLVKTLRYINDLAYQRVTGTTKGNLTHYPSGAQVPYTETGTFSAGDVVASVDFVKNEVWFFNAAGNVKKVATTTKPVAVVFAPRWAAEDNVVTTVFIVTVSQIIQLTTTFGIASTEEVTAGVVAASGDLSGNIVLTYASSLVLWSPTTGAVINTVTGPELTGLHSLYVLHDNSYITGGTGGLKRTVQSGSSFLTSVIIPYNGQYISATSNADHLFVVDGMNRCLYSIAQADWSYITAFFDDVPRSVVVKDTKVYVGFFDVTTSLTFALDLTDKQTLTTTKTFGAAYLTDYVVTDLYTDANTVTIVDAVASTVLIDPGYQDIGAALRYDWVVTWPRPEFAKLATSPGATVTVNGKAFTSGYLRFGDVVRVDFSATSEYYNDRFATFMGRRPTMIRMRTVPKLYPDPVVLPDILEAFPRTPYTSAAYTVTGMTEGFAAEVVSAAGESEVTFSVNGGESGFTGTIHNGDSVVVTSVLRNLIQKRNTHTTLTAVDKPVFTITLLPIVLNGVTVRKEKTDLRKRYDGAIGGSPTTNPVLPYTPKHMLQRSIVLADLDPPTAQMLPAASDLFAYRYDAVKQLQGTLVPQAMPYVHVQHPGGHWAKLPQKETVRNEPFNSFRTESTPSQYKTTFRMWSGQKWFRNVHPKYVFTKATYRRNNLHHVEFVLHKFQMHQLNHVEYLNAVYGRHQRYHVEAIRAVYLRDDAKSKHYIDWVIETRALWHQEPIGTSFERKHWASHLISASYAMHHAKTVEIAALYHWRRPNAPAKIQAQFLRANPSAITIAKATPIYAAASQDYTLPESESGFGSRAQAEAYADEVNAERTSFFQITGKWIFIARPEAENASCGIIILPPDQQKRYGYLGGG